MKQLEPAALWNHFHALTQIPHPSGHTEQIREFLLSFGKGLQLNAFSDEVGNVIIQKSATTGMENCPTVILQAHMDMVPQKGTDSTHNFTTDPLQTIVEGDWIRANNTTLGADDGLGVAAIMAVLSSTDLVHGPIEALFTMDEETGMIGAFGLKKDCLKGSILLNLDSEQEGELFVGCAGGIDADITFGYQPVSVPEGDVALKITLSGLHGGHSGIDIGLERANAIKLLFRFLKTAIAEYDARLAYVSGGSLRNAIPRECEAIITVSDDAVADIAEFVSMAENTFIQEYTTIENQIHLDIETVEMPKNLLPEEVQDDLINAVCAAPNGVFRHTPQDFNQIESSLNMSTISTSEGTVKIGFLIRSANNSIKDDITSTIESLFTMAGANVKFSGEYPGWKPNFNSPILLLVKDIYKKQFGAEAKVTVIHAGLECGIIAATYPHLDMISFGPTIKHPHSPSEKANISSVGHFWELLISILKEISNK